MATSLNNMFRAMADPNRRHLLMALLEQDPRSDIALDPVNDVWLSDVDTEYLTIEMDHIHLPMLEESGLIDWDRDTHAVEKGEHFDEIRPFLSYLKANPDTIAQRA